jgi:predicted O-linked N-acetylglucosamine transferase (SPINDLY family)
MRSQATRDRGNRAPGPNDHFVRSAHQRFEKAKECERAGNYDESEKILTELAGTFERNKLDAGSCLCALGYAQMAQKKYDEAIESYQRSLQYDENLLQTHVCLATIYRIKERWQDTLVHADKALSLKADSSAALLAKGHACFNLRRYAEAIQSFVLILTIKPNDWNAMAGMALVFGVLGDIDTTQALYRKLLQEAPEAPSARSNFLFQIHYDPDMRPDDLCEEHLRYGEILERRFEPKAHSFRNRRSSDRKLRVGYVSGDFRSHVVSFFTEAVLREHNRDNVELFCFANNKSNDAVTERFQAFSDGWFAIKREPDNKVEELIRDHQIDILIDLAGHTADNRLPVFARKPAPIQASWCGYFDTTGLRAMDYLIVDRVIAPENEQRKWTERPLYVPDSYICYQPPKLPDLAAVPAEQNGFVTFGCFNNPSKINHRLVEMWAAILEVVGGSKLILQHYVYSDPLARERLDRIFRQAGVPSNRYEYVLGGSNYQTLECYNRVDITLDCLPYNGGTTTCESLWMGVPVVTLYGDRFVSRVGSSILTFSGLGGLVATTPGEYVERAAALAGNRDDLCRLRGQLRSHLPKTPVFNPKLFVQGLEDAYRRAFNEWCSECA